MAFPEAGRRSWRGTIVGGIAVLAVGAAVGWAGTAVFTPPRELVETTPFTYVELAEGEVGSSVALNTAAEWAQIPAGTNRAVGTVTAVHASAGDETQAGVALYDVNLRPVIVAQGAVPSFRDLARGLEGPDVAQLQQLLASLGFYDGAQDGGFGAATQRAVRAWQESLGLDDDGIVRAGDLMFVPTLPGRVVVDTEQVFRGASLSGGENVVFALAPEPTFTIAATVQQATMMPVGTPVEISIENLVWHASVAGQQPAADGADKVEVQLQGSESGSVCGDQCGLVPVQGESLLTSRIVTQETVAGIVAPSAALLTSPNGSVSVIDESGELHPVQVLASAQGMSVIEGLPAGIRVRVPASENDAA